MGNYLITGLTGFAGPHLARQLLRDGHTVHGLIRGSNGRQMDLLDILSSNAIENIKFIYGDLKNRSRIEEIISSNTYDGVFHLAAQSHPPTSFIDPIGTYEDNVLGSLNLIEAIIRYQKDNCKLMFCSTSEVYGNQGQDGRLITEEERVLPSNPYGNSKATIDLYLQERIENGFINAYITRAFSHTGPRRGKNFSISSDAYQIAKMILGKQERVLQIGNLETTRVVMDVRDCVNAYKQLMYSSNSTGQIYNVCGDTPHKMRVYTDLLIKASGLEDITEEINPAFYRPIDIHYQHGDTTKLKQDVDWNTVFSLEETLEDLLQYWVDKLK